MRIDKDTPIEVIREKLVDGMAVKLEMATPYKGIIRASISEVTLVVDDGSEWYIAGRGGYGAEWVCNIDDWYIDMPDDSQLQDMPVGVKTETIAIPTPAELLKVEATKLEEAIKGALGEFSDKTGLAVGNISHCVETMRTGIGDLQSLWYHDIEVDIEWKGAI